MPYAKSSYWTTRKRNKERKLRELESERQDGPPRRKRNRNIAPPPPPQSEPININLWQERLRPRPEEMNRDKNINENNIPDNRDRIFMPEEIEERDEQKLYLAEDQIDTILKHIEIAANNRDCVKYLSAKLILSDAPFPSLQNTELILVPFIHYLQIKGKKFLNGNIMLAVFDLITMNIWRFYLKPHHKYPKFGDIKEILENKLRIKFNTEKHPRECSKFLYDGKFVFNDSILVFRTAEEIFFSKCIKLVDNFDIDLERLRYQKIYDMILENDDFEWPATTQNENDDDGDDENTTLFFGKNSAASSGSEIQITEPYSSNNEISFSSNAQSTVNEVRSSISDNYDFDDVQSLRSPIPNPSASDLLSSIGTQSSSFLHSSSSNLVNNQLNSSILPPVSLKDFEKRIKNRQRLSSYDTNSVPSTVDREINLSSAQNSLSDHDQPLYGPFLPPLAFNDIIVDWRRSLTPDECLDEDYVDESLSSIGSSSSDSEDDEEINVELSPRYYNDTNDSSNEEAIDINTATNLTENCYAIKRSFRLYWRCVRKLAEDRHGIIRKLKKRLDEQPLPLFFNNDEQVIRINSKIKLIEEMLNSTIPIVPRLKVSYQNGTDKKIIIRKGYIYERIGETNEFQCVYKKETVFHQCDSIIEIDNCDVLIDGSFCYHNHPAADNEKYTYDVPPPPETPVSFLRVSKEGEKWGKYEKLIAFLDETLIELLKWRDHMIICDMKLELLQKYLHDVENTRHPNNEIGFLCEIVIAETKNLLNCIRLDKQ